MSKNVGAILLAVVFVFFIVWIASDYGIHSIGATAEGVNHSTVYESQYQAATNTSLVAVQIFQVNPYLVAILSVIVVILGLVWFTKR